MAEAERLWSDIEGFAAYSFNKSHAVEYTLIAFQAAWLKAHYLVEFYCAQMGTTKDDKLTVLVKQAAQDGIRIIPPDINISTHQFEPLNDVIIAAPLNVVMGVSEKGAAAIIKERQSTEPTIIEKTSGRGSKKVTTQTTFGPGRFVSIEDFKARVPAKSVNARGIDNLDRVGAFARIEPGQIASTDPRRQKDQIELMPAIADQGVVADRVVEIDDMLVDALEAIEKDMAQLLPAAVNCFIGKNPKLMIILDAPFNDFEELKAQYSYKTFVAPSLHAAGLNVEDAVWTWLLRRPLAKGESSPPDAEVAQCLPFLQREVAVMKPPVIVLLGPTVIKTFFPDIKRPADNIGHKAFSANLDATVIIGFKPTQIYHDAGKADRLTEIFSEAKSLLEDSAC
ncbi:uracil-DNA glycosylase family protein [Novosphingobium sp. NPDC080210]|uniref:helix-hairpin-helix domain-containing protein n=1 Tax=Novosphingobium sp. NPDC080210 TaxID=3390596 RepID=UPI003D02BCFE